MTIKTVKDMYRALLIHQNKVGAPNILLEDFNVFLAKSINSYLNKKYNIFEKNQQSTDDLQFLVSNIQINSLGIATGTESYDALLVDGVYTYSKAFKLSPRYWHLLGIWVEYSVVNSFGCNEEGSILSYPAVRITAPMYTSYSNDSYKKPAYRRPYFRLMDYLDTGSLETAPTDDGTVTVPKVEILAGNLAPNLKFNKFIVEYLRKPKEYTLTTVQRDGVNDESQKLEFPEYVNQEILNELLIMVMENTTDQRIQSYTGVSQSIAN